jgi:hypothetical protein
MQIFTQEDCCDLKEKFIASLESHQNVLLI